MSFRDIIERVNGSRSTLTVLNVDAPPRAVEQVAGYLGPQQVRFRTDETETGLPTNLAVLHQGETFLAASPFEDVYRQVDVETGIHTATDLDAAPYPDVLRGVDNTTFSELGKRRMIIASREVEKRAWDVGDGEIHTGFQRLSLVESQERVYSKLGDSPVETHVYGRPNWTVPGDLGVQAHGIDEEEIGRSWFVVFDGDGDDDEKCALLAEEVGDNVYSGFWTYEADLVDEIYGYLTTTYREDGVGGRESGQDSTA